MIGMAIAQGLDERGQVGATHMGTSFDAWYPGYVDYAPAFKNIPAFWTETAGNQAAPREYTLNDLPPAFRDLRPQSLYSSPWPAGWWRLADAVDYDETAALSTLEYAAKYKDVAPLQPLPGRARPDREGQDDGAVRLRRSRRSSATRWPPVEMLRRLAFGGVRVSQLTAPATIDGVELPGGHVGGPDRPGVRGDGARGARRAEVPGPAPVPGRAAAAAVRRGRLDAAAADGRARWPTRRSRSATTCARSWRRSAPAAPARSKVTPYNMTEPKDAAPFDSVPGIGFDSEPGGGGHRPARRDASPAPARCCSSTRPQNNAYRAINRAWKQGATVGVVRARHGSGRAVRHQRAVRVGAGRRSSRTLALVAERSTRRRRAARRSRGSACSSRGPAAWTRAGRAGCSSSTASSSCSLHPEDFQTPLGDRVDVLHPGRRRADPDRGRGGGGRGEARAGRRAPAAGAPASAGRRRGGGPRRPARVRLRADAGRPAGVRGVRPRRRHARLLQQRHPVRHPAVQAAGEERRRRAASPKSSSCAGRSSRSGRTSTHPVMAGHAGARGGLRGRQPGVRHARGLQGHGARPLRRTPARRCCPGYLIGEKYLQGKAAALDVELDQGHVVLLGFRPQWRDQSFGTFRVASIRCSTRPLGSCPSGAEG